MQGWKCWNLGEITKSGWGFHQVGYGREVRLYTSSPNFLIW